MRQLIPVLTISLSACATVTGREAAPAPAFAPASTPAADITAAWDDAQLEAVLARTQRTHLAPDLSALSNGERAAARELLAAGERLHRLYLQQRHPEALAALAYLEANPDRALERELFQLSNGPIASTLDNRREAFLSVSAETPTRNVYPAGVTRAVLDAYFEAHPERRAELLDHRAVVWPATPENRARALTTLSRYEALNTLHPGLRDRLTLSADYLAVPYSVAFADDIMFVYDRLNAAAAHVDADDPAFARYLRLRARDLLTDDYESGDAAWVTGGFTGNLNAQIGAYETYDDALYGVKTFFSFSLLVRDRARSAELNATLTDIQAVENALPYAHHREIRADIPVGVYNVIADFGQARGLNAATILPNEPYLARQYGRIILMRGNILLNNDVFQEAQRNFAAAIVDAQASDLVPEGSFYYALYHEVGHYLGVQQTQDGSSVADALQETADLFEELKADLVALTSARILRERGRLSDTQVRAVYAAGIRRVLQKRQPQPDNPYQRMALMQFNWHVQQGTLRLQDGRLRIDYERYPYAVSSLLREVLAIQRTGDHAAAQAFIADWTTWRPELHEAVARQMRESERVRFNLVTYEALENERWLDAAPPAPPEESAPIPLRGFMSR